MPKQSISDAEAYDKEYDAFLKQLEDFHQQRGTPFKKLPRINGKGIDLYLLFVVVTARGGWQKVNSRSEWNDILEDFWLHPACVNSSTALKHIYIRYLDVYERIHYLGEDGSEQANDADEDDSRAVRIKRSVRNLNNVPLTYNQQQHNVTDSARSAGGLSTDLVKISMYDRLALSLSCPLPNEHDFAFNMCTLLSNEGKHTLQLCQCSRLIELMLAHTGVFKDEHTQKYFISNYKESKGKSLVQFWIDSVQRKSVLELLKPEAVRSRTTTKSDLEASKIIDTNSDVAPPPEVAPSQVDSQQTLPNVTENITVASKCTDSRNEDQRGTSPIILNEISITSSNVSSVDSKLEEVLPCEVVDLKLEPQDSEIFHLGRDLGLLDSEGTRISQVLHILRNLSFEEINVSNLAQSKTCLRFLVLCVCSRWGGLSVGALDTLGNIASEVTLQDPKLDATSMLLLTTVCQGVSAQDRAFVLRCLEVLNKLAVNDANEEILGWHIEQLVFDQICRYLTIHDIMLLIYTLECLFSLSSLGTKACNAIVRAKGSIQTLISLLTVEAQSYGPEACIGMKVVETVTGVVSESEPTDTPTTTVTSEVTSTTTTNTTAVTTNTTPQTVTTPATTPAAVAQSQLQRLVSGNNTPLTPKVLPKPMADPKRLAARIVPREVEDFAMDWVKRNYESSPTNGIEQAIVYRHFTASMHALGKKQGLNPVFLSSCVRKVFGIGVGPSRKRVEDGSEKWHYVGIRRRDGILASSSAEKSIHANVAFPPTPILPSSPVPKPAPLLSTSTEPSQPGAQLPTCQGSILKAHLSAPLRNSPSPIRISPQSGLVRSSSPTAHPFNSDVIYRHSVATAAPQQMQTHRSDNSALIKSLLATKVTSGVCCLPSAADRGAVAPPRSQHHQQVYTPQQPVNLTQRENVISAVRSGLGSVQPPVLQSGPLPSMPLTKMAQSVLGNVPPLQCLPSPRVAANIQRPTASTGIPQMVQVIHKPHQISRHVQMQNGPLDPPNENSVDAQNAKAAIINGICNETKKIENEALPTSFEGILQNGLKEEPKDIQNCLEEQLEKKNLLADLLEKTVGGDVLNGVVDKGLQVANLSRMSGSSAFNGPIEGLQGGIKRSATPDTSQPVKRLALEDPRAEPDSKITLYVSQNGNDGEILSQGHQAVLNQGHQISSIVTPGISGGQMLNTQTMVTPQGQVIIQRALSQGNVLIQQSPNFGALGLQRSHLNQRTISSTQYITNVPQTQGHAIPIVSSSPVITQTSQNQVISSPMTQVINSNGQVIQQMIAQSQGGQKVILHGGQISQVLGGQVLMPQSNNQTLVMQGSGNIPGQVIMQGISSNNQSPIFVQGANGQNQVLVHGGSSQGQQMLLQTSTGGQSQIVMSSQGLLSSVTQSPVVVSNSSGQTMIVATSHGQSVLVGGTQQGQQLMVNSTVPGQQMVVQGNSMGNTVFLTPQQGQTGQKTLIILPNQKICVSGNQAQNNQVLLPRQVVQVVSGSATPPVVTSPHVRTVRSVSSTNTTASPVTVQMNAAASPVTVQVNTAVAPLPKGPMAIPVTPSVSIAPSQSPHIPAPQVISSGIVRRPTKTGLQYVCEWRGCNHVFSSPGLVYHHACSVHCPSHLIEINCQWLGCEPMVRKRFSAMTHIHDRHCNEQLLQIHAMRRQQMQLSGKTEIPIPQTPPPHPGYAPNAAFHAIKRHALEVITQRDVVEKEGPVTKSIRLTAALILRNLVIYSNIGKKLLHGYESELANVAISSMESSRTVGQILYDINLPDHQTV